MLLDQITLSIEQQEYWHTAHTIAPGKLTPRPIQNIQPQYSHFSAQVGFQPIHDGLGNQALRSKIGVEFHNHWLTGG